MARLLIRVKNLRAFRNVILTCLAAANRMPFPALDALGNSDDAKRGLQAAL
jgi:hypothetical protein